MKTPEQNLNNNEIMKEIVEKNMQNWFFMLETKDPKKVSELYTEDSLFLPTVSPDFKKGKEDANDYFIHFLEKNPGGEIVDRSVIWINDNNYLDTGMYNFEIGSEDDRQVVEARFSFLWRKEENQWKIAHHHSSVRPK